MTTVDICMYSIYRGLTFSFTLSGVFVEDVGSTCTLVWFVYVASLDTRELSTYVVGSKYHRKKTLSSLNPLINPQP